MLEWADAEETVETLRRKTAEHFHGKATNFCDNTQKWNQLHCLLISFFRVIYSPCQWPPKSTERQRFWREFWRRWKPTGVWKTELPSRCRLCRSLDTTLTSVPVFFCIKRTVNKMRTLVACAEGANHNEFISRS